MEFSSKNCTKGSHRAYQFVYRCFW